MLRKARMTETFIGLVSNWMLEHYHNDMFRPVVVVPARRAIRFFTGEFERHYRKLGVPGIIPEIITLSDLTDRSSACVKLSGIELQFHFYEVYSKLKNEPESFEKFLTWSASVLNDFNETDNYLLNANQVFSDLRNIHDIEEWSFSLDALSEGQQNLNTFWMELPKLYSAWKEYQQENLIGSGAFIIRQLAEDPTKIIQAWSDRHFIFAGFNALTACEQRIMNYLLDQQVAHVFFDEDDYYANNTMHEAGLFIRKNKEALKDRTKGFDAAVLLSGKKEINVYETQGELLQTRKLSALLSVYDPAIHGTACVVLCNEQILPAVINELPEQWSKINVTMGWPLKFTNVSDFVRSVLDIASSLDRNNGYISREEIQRFIQVSNTLFPDIKLSIHDPANANEFLNAFSDTPYEVLFKPLDGNCTLIIQRIHYFLSSRIDTSKNEIDGEIIVHFIEVFARILQIEHFAKYISGWNLLRQIIVKFMRNAQLSFIGEPLEGIQVMGMLETRALDFDTIFVLSVNEGFLPAKITDQSFFPYDLKKHFQLPGKAEQDAVYAYYFYRLIQRATNIHLFYSTATDQYTTGEKSRYLLQLGHELAEKNKNVKIVQHSISPFTGDIGKRTVFKKDDFYFKRLNEIAQKGFTASQVNTWLNCELDFYFKHILRVRDDEDDFILEESHVGEIVHIYLDELLKDSIGKVLSPKIFSNALSSYKSEIDTVVKKKYPRYNISSGTNFLAIQLVKEMIKRFLDMQLTDQAFLPGKIVEGCELELTENVDLDNGSQLRITGKIDLLMRNSNGEFFVYDFKTGKSDESELKLKKVPDESSMNSVMVKHSKLIQLFFYQLMVEKKYKTDRVNASIIPLGSGSKHIFSMQLPETSNDDFRKFFLTHFRNEIFQKEKILLHRNASKFCDFCN